MTAVVNPVPTQTVKRVGSVTVAFSPHGEAEALIVAALAAAKHTIHLQAYEFSSKTIADALIAAMTRGVVIIVLLDKENAIPTSFVGMRSLLPALKAAAVPTFIDGKVLIAHSKVIIIDASVTVTGSYNFSGTAQTSNSENLLVLHDKRVAAIYEQDFQWRLSISIPA